MKKKIFTLLALALCISSAAWAETEWIMANWPSNATSYNGLTYWASGSEAAISSSGTDKNVPSWADGSAYNTYFGTGGSSTFQLKNNVLNSTNRVFQFTVSAGDAITVYFMGGGNGDRSMYLSYNASSTNRDTQTAFGSATANGYTPTILTATASSAGTVYLWTDSNVRVYAIKVASSTTPAISATDATVKATESGVAATTNIDVTGVNLTGSTLTATLSPAVEGLSVTLGSNAIASGSISTTVTVSYTSTVNVAPGTTTLTLSDGTTSKEVTISYSASITEWTLQSISEATKWDFSTGVTGAKLFEGADVNTEFVYANITDLTYSSSFDATTLAFKGQYPFRDNSHKYAQNGVLRFNTTVPGSIIVKFSDTGTSASSSAQKRYLIVNGVQTEYWASRANNSTDSEVAYEAQLNVTTDKIPVPAGDVTIAGSSALIYTSIEFTPAAATTINLNGKGYATYSNYYDVAVSGAKVYTAVLDFDKEKITCTEVSSGKVPAGEGVLLYGTAGAEVTLTPTTGADALTTINQLHATTLADGTLASKGDGDCYSLSGDTFMKYTGESFVANKAYFESGSLSARSFTIEFVDDGYATAIDGVSAAERSADSVYDLQGRRVEKPVKGLYVVNGKKVVIK